jgi:leader peptidase (prepilin peptidase) / N-methyltransferase
VTTAIVVASALLGVPVGAAIDVVVARVPERLPVLGADARAALVPRRAGALALGCAALFAGTAARLADSWALPAYLTLAAGLVALSLIDLEHYLLPNRIVYPLTVAVVVLLALGSLGDGDGAALLRGLVGGAAAFVALGVLHLASPRSMGFGDVKLAFVLGVSLAWLGWGELAVGMFLAFLYGAVVGVALIALRLRGRKDHVPFGPFLAAGTLTAVLWGDAILRWYDG